MVRRALGDLVDGDHFFDIVADNVVYEVLYEVAGWPRVIRGRADLMAQFGGYCDNVALQFADRLITHKSDNGQTVVIEYEVHGTMLATGVKYDNRFCSIIKIENRKIAHWRQNRTSVPSLERANDALERLAAGCQYLARRFSAFQAAESHLWSLPCAIFGFSILMIEQNRL